MPLSSAASDVYKRQGNLFQMYEKITADNPYETPMKIYPALHYTMGGVWAVSYTHLRAHET
nr:hypothetical protein [Elizabethkingia sp. ASV34]